MNIVSSDIEAFFNQQLKSRDVPTKISNDLVAALINASLMGIDSHGVNLFSHYLDCIDNGRIDTNGQIELRQIGSAVICNANENFSHHAAQLLLKDLSRVSEDTGIALGVLKNSDHIGAVGIHAFNSNICAKIIIGLTNADALAATPDGKRTIFGTNPVSLIYRHSSEEYVYIDLATTKFSMNKVKNYGRAGIELPYGVARDEKGNITMEPSAVTALEPIGAHKGFALAFLVELLTSGLSGCNHSFEIPPMYYSDLKIKRKLSHSFIVINPQIISGINNEFVWNTVEKTRELLSADDFSMSPGIKEHNSIKDRLESGIPVLEEVVNDWLNRGFQHG